MANPCPNGGEIIDYALGLCSCGKCAPVGDVRRKSARFRTLRLDDGTAWPEPLRDETLADKLNCHLADTVTLTRHEAWALREIVGAYAHLAEHPAGVEAAVARLRMLRRKVREVPGA